MYGYVYRNSGSYPSPMNNVLFDDRQSQMMNMMKNIFVDSFSQINNSPLQWAVRFRILVSAYKRLKMIVILFR